ncbi:MAG: hypothetical protein ABI759_21260 [Candidatus Solibacter sp.]
MKEASGYALPNAICTLLAFLIFILCQTAICRCRTSLLYGAAALLAVGMNHKMDFLMLAKPIAIAAVQMKWSPCAVPPKFLPLAGRMVLCFSTVLLATQPYLLTSPLREFAMQYTFLAERQGAVNLPLNLAKLWHFLGMSLSLTPGGEPVGSHLVIAGVVTLLVLIAVLPALGGHGLSRSQRVGCAALVLASMGALWAVPVRTSADLYPRYFLNGWGVLLAGTGCGHCIALANMNHARTRFVLACLAIVSSVPVIYARFDHIRQTDAAIWERLDPTFHLDTGLSRNAATLELVKSAASPDFSKTVLIDQHAYLDIRAFILAGLHPVYINANDYEAKLHGLPPGRYLTLFTKGTWDVNPKWQGSWPEELQARYQAYLAMLSQQPVVWRRDGPVAGLLEWYPPQAGDNMTLAIVSLPR